MKLQGKLNRYEDGSATQGCTSKPTYNYEKLVEDHYKASDKVINCDVKILREEIDNMESLVGRLISTLPTTASDMPSFLSSTSMGGLSKIGTAIPVKLSRIRRHYREMTMLAHGSTTTLDTLKLWDNRTKQELLDYELQLNALKRDIEDEQFAVSTPKFNSIIHSLQHQTDINSRPSVTAAAEPDPLNAVITKKSIEYDSNHDVSMQNVQQEPVLDVSHLKETPEIEMRYDTSEDLAQALKMSTTGGCLEECYLTWLKCYLACRTKESAGIESVKQSRSAGEEKLKQFRKCDAELASKLNSLEKDVSKLATTIARTTASSNSLGGSKLLSPLMFPQKAYSLSPPLLTLFTKFFCYKAVNGDASVDLRLSFQHTTKDTDPLYECDPGRLHIVIDKSSIFLPPLTFSKTASLFPLTIRFSYFPKLALVAVACQFPRAIGSDVALFTDLCFPDDDGNASPNPLHHIATDVSQILPFTEDVVSPTNPTTATECGQLPYAIGSGISDLQAGRPYRWAQILAEISFSVDASAVTKLDVSPEKKANVTVGHLIKTFRLRASRRALNFYVEESLRDNPCGIPPYGITLPPTLEASKTLAASMYRSFTQCSSNDFLSAGGSSEYGGTDVHFLHAQLHVNMVVFDLFVANAVENKSPSLCFYIKELLHTSSDNASSPKNFTFAMKLLLSLKNNNIPQETLGAVALYEQARILLDDTDRNTLDAFLLYSPVTSASTESTSYGKIGNVDMATTSQLYRMFNSLYPASSHVPSSPSLPACPLTHFKEPSLAAIQEAVNKTLPLHLSAEQNSDSCHVMLVMQLVQLAFLLDGWVRDIQFNGDIFLKWMNGIRVNEYKKYVLRYLTLCHAVIEYCSFKNPKCVPNEGFRPLVHMLLVIPERYSRMEVSFYDDDSASLVLDLQRGLTLTTHCFGSIRSWITRWCFA